VQRRKSGVLALCCRLVWWRGLPIARPRRSSALLTGDVARRVNLGIEMSSGSTRAGAHSTALASGACVAAAGLIGLVGRSVPLSVTAGAGG